MELAASSGSWVVWAVGVKGCGDRMVDNCGHRTVSDCARPHRMSCFLARGSRGLGSGCVCKEVARKPYGPSVETDNLACQISTGAVSFAWLVCVTITNPSSPNGRRCVLLHRVAVCSAPASNGHAAPRPASAAAAAAMPAANDGFQQVPSKKNRRKA
jgi:hypothetical protein